jgi:hypothetical protein
MNGQRTEECDVAPVGKQLTATDVPLVPPGICREIKKMINCWMNDWTDGWSDYVTETVIIMKWNKMTATSQVSYSLLYVLDEDFSLQVVFPDRVVEVSQQVRRHHDVNRSVQPPGAGPEVKLPTQTSIKLIYLYKRQVLGGWLVGW